MNLLRPYAPPPSVASTSSASATASSQSSAVSSVSSSASPSPAAGSPVFSASSSSSSTSPSVPLPSLVSPFPSTIAGDFSAPVFQHPTPPFVGLINQGCTCYLDSLLQVLFHLAPFRELIFMGAASGRPAAAGENVHAEKKSSAPDTVGVHDQKLICMLNWLVVSSFLHPFDFSLS